MKTPLLFLAALSAALTLSAAPAQGVDDQGPRSRLAGSDPAGDVARHDLGDDDETAVGVPEPQRRQADLTRYVVRYGPERISVRLAFRDLARSRQSLTAVARFQYRAEGRLQDTEAVVRARPSHRAGSSRLSVTVADCTTAHRVDHRRDRITVSFPAGCIGSPRWVRFNAAVFTSERPFRPRQVHVDDVYPVFGAPGEVERFSRRIMRP